MKNLYQKLFEVKQKGIKLQRNTNAYNYKYATLDQIQEKLWPILEKLQLAIIHKIINNEVVTIIYDIENNSQIESSILMSEGIKPQDKGSEITYYRRYNLLALFDLEVEDDDGKAAQYSNTKKSLPKFTQQIFEKFKEKENYKDYFDAKKIIEQKYTLDLNMAKQVKDYYDMKIDGQMKEMIGTEGNPPF